MKEYSLHLAGLRVILRTPFEITISDNLRPFLYPPHKENDCTIALQSCVRLPAFSQDGRWHGPEYYDCYQGAMRIFHCIAPEKDAFAVTQLFENGNIRIDILPEYLSYFTGSTGIFNRIGLETLLQQHNGLLLHASLIKYRGYAIGFVGPSGVGKSTQAALWKQHLAAEIMNGDRAVLRKEAAGWMAYGSPHAGTSGIYQNVSAPLTALVLLQQGKENSLRPLEKGEAFRYLYPELSMHRWDKGFVAKVTDLCLQLLEAVPVYLLRCVPEESAVLLVKKGLGL